MSLADVSVVIVNWNGRRYLEGCLASIPGGVEVVLVDNGSSDGSVAFVRDRFPAVAVVENGRNLGFSAANNVGARVAHGAFLLFLNNDTVVRPGALERLRTAFDADSRIGVVGARLEGAEGRPQPLSIGRLPTLAGEVRRVLSAVSSGAAKDDFAYGHSQEVPAVCGAAVMLRRDVLDAVGGWQEKYFAYAEDADLCVRARELGHAVWYESGARVMHFHGGSGRHAGLRAALGAQVVSYRSVNRFIRYHEGGAQALLHAGLFPLDVVLRGVRRMVGGGGPRRAG